MQLAKQTPKQQEIIKLQYRFRFLNTIQLQKFLNHNDKKRLNIWLKYLVSNDYLVRIYDPHKFGENTKPAVFYIGKNGIRFLKAQGNYLPELLRKLYRENNRSETFKSNSQLLADIALDLKAQSKKGLTFNWATASDYTNPDSPFYSFSFLTELSTRLMFTREKNNEKKYFLLEILNTSFPPYRVRKKIRSYLKFLLDCDWMEHFKTPPEILFICQTKDLLIRTKRYAKKLLVDEYKENIHISFALEDEVKKYGATAEIWEEV